MVGNKCLFPLRTGRSTDLSFLQILFMYSGVKVSTSSDPLSITVRLHSTTRRISDALTQTNLDHNDGPCPFSPGSESSTLIALEISVFSTWIWCSCDHCQLTEHVCEIKMTLGQVSLYLDLSFSVSRVHSQEAPCKMLPQHHLCPLHSPFFFFLPCQICPPQPTFSGFYISLLIQKTYYQAPSVDSCQRYSHSSFHNRI